MLSEAMLAYSLAGFAVGGLVGMTGVGGGSLMTPILLMLGTHPATAVGTDLLFAASTKTVGSAAHGWHGTIEWKLVRALAAGSLPAAALSIYLLSRLDLSKGPHWLIVALGICLVLTGAALLFNQRIQTWALNRHSAITPRLRHILTVVLGAAIGVAVAFTSIGAGSLAAVALIILYPELPANRIAGTDIAHAVPLALLSGLGHWWLGTVDFALLGYLLVGSLPGVVLGSITAAYIASDRLRLILAGALLLVGVQLLL